MKFRSRVFLPPDPVLTFKNPSLVQRQFARDTDINYMIQRYMHGDASVLARHGNQIVDATSLPESLHDALNVKTNADYLWSSLPPQVQASYGNYANFLAALERNQPVKPVNAEKAEKAVKAETSVTSNPTVTPPEGGAE